MSYGHQTTPRLLERGPAGRGSRGAASRHRRSAARTLRLLDGDLALHARLPVAGHGAIERVGPRLERDLDRRDLAALDDRALVVDAVALDGDVVGRRGLVL